MKLLIVDPDRDLVEMLTSWLKTLGYEVYRAYTGDRAKIEWEEQEPDLVLLDTAIKDVDALEMCQMLRHMSRRGRSSLSQRPSSIITVGPLRVDSLHNEVTINGKMARLTPTESKLLHLLAINANNVCTANQIVSHIWGFGNDGDTSLIKAHIRHLRQKIEPDPSKPTYILTVPGVGYTLIRHSSEEANYSSKEVVRTLRAISI